MADAKLNISLDDLPKLESDLTSGSPGAALDFAHASGDTVIADVATKATEDAAAGAAVGAGVAWVAAQLGIEDVVAAVIIDAAAEVGISVGAGAGLGSVLGPIGAAIGAIIGVIVALVTIGAAKGANGFSSPNPWTDPDGITRPGSLLAGEAQDYLSSHPFNPLLQIQLAQDPSFQDALGKALGPQFDWSAYNASMAGVFALDATKTRYAGWNANSPVFVAWRHFFATLNAKGVPPAAVAKVIDAYADFQARVRAAEDAYTSGLPEGFTIDPDAKAGSSNALTWHVHDMFAAQAFDGLTPQIDPNATGEEGLGWAHSYRVRKTGDAWHSISSSPYYKDLSSTLTALAKNAKLTVDLTNAPKITILKGSVMHEVLDAAKEKAQEAVEVVYKDGAVTKTGKVVGAIAGLLVVLKVLAGRK